MFLSLDLLPNPKMKIRVVIEEWHIVAPKLLCVGHVWAAEPTSTGPGCSERFLVTKQKRLKPNQVRRTVWELRTVSVFTGDSSPPKMDCCEQDIANSTGLLASSVVQHISTNNIE
jgi:hypothetical protein